MYICMYMYIYDIMYRERKRGREREKERERETNTHTHTHARAHTHTHAPILTHERFMKMMGSVFVVRTKEQPFLHMEQPQGCSRVKKK